MNVDSVDMFTWIANKSNGWKRFGVDKWHIVCIRNGSRNEAHTHFFLLQKEAHICCLFCDSAGETGFCVSFLHKISCYKYWFRNIILSGGCWNAPKICCSNQTETPPKKKLWAFYGNRGVPVLLNANGKWNKKTIVKSKHLLSLSDSERMQAKLKTNEGNG